MIPIDQHAPGVIRHLADPALRALVPAGLAALALWLLRVRQSSLRLAAWTGVLYTALAMPFLGGLLPELPLRLPALPVRVASSALSTQRGIHSPPGSSVTLALLPADFDSARVPATLTNVPRQHGSIPWAHVALAVYVLVTAFLLGRLGAGLAVGRRLWRESHPICDQGARLVLETQARALGLARIPRLAQSEVVTVPLTVGVLDPVILLPHGWREWESAKLAAVITHELSHVKRNDGLTRILSLGYQCFFWFSPLAWWLDRHLADLAEQASDQETIAAGAEPIYYAEVLMSFFKAIDKGQGRVRLQGVSMARSARASHRIEKVLSTPAGVPARFKQPLLLILAAACGAPVVGLVAAAHPLLVGNAFAPPPAAQTVHREPSPPPQPAPVGEPAPGVAGVGATPGPPPRGPRRPQHPEAPAPPSEGISSGVPSGDENNWIFNNRREGMDFAIVSGKSVMMNGSEDDRDEVESLRKRINGDFIWLIHNGQSYVIRDAATVKAARELYAPMEELGRKQEALGKQQEALGEQQEALGKQMEAIKINVPGDLEARLKKVESMIRGLGPTASQEQLGRLQGEIGDLQGEIGELQGKAGGAQGALGRQQGELGRKQGELGRQQGELGREQGRLAREASRKMQTILLGALSSGLAQRAP